MLVWQKAKVINGRPAWSLSVRGVGRYVVAHDGKTWRGRLNGKWSAYASRSPDAVKRRIVRDVMIIDAMEKRQEIAVSIGRTP